MRKKVKKRLELVETQLALSLLPQEYEGNGTFYSVILFPWDTLYLTLDDISHLICLASRHILHMISHRYS